MRTVTRDTVRADGLTVGEAIARDGEYLKSMGIVLHESNLPCDDEERQDRIITAVRGDVLDALDEHLDGKGWIDGDLPELFKAIDNQVKRVIARKVSAI